MANKRNNSKNRKTIVIIMVIRKTIPKVTLGKCVQSPRKSWFTPYLLYLLPLHCLTLLFQPSTTELIAIFIDVTYSFVNYGYHYFCYCYYYSS